MFDIQKHETFTLKNHPVVLGDDVIGHIDVTYNVMAEYARKALEDADDLEAMREMVASIGGITNGGDAVSTEEALKLAAEVPYLRASIIGGYSEAMTAFFRRDKSKSKGSR